MKRTLAQAIQKAKVGEPVIWACPREKMSKLTKRELLVEIKKATFVAEYGLSEGLSEQASKQIVALIKKSGNE